MDYYDNEFDEDGDYFEFGEEDDGMGSEYDEQINWKSYNYTGGSGNKEKVPYKGREKTPTQKFIGSVAQETSAVVAAGFAAISAGFRSFFN